MARAEAALLTDDARLLNRELSWLDYNARVLARASDPALPLLERSRSCAYFSSNLDEFFQVRVAGLMGQEEAGLLVRSPDGRTAPETLAAIREKTLELTASAGETLEARASSGFGRRRRDRRRGRGLQPQGAGRARAALRARHLPDPHAARGGAGSAVSLHLTAVSEPRHLRPRPGFGRGAVRPRQGPRAASALLLDRHARALPPPRARHPALSAATVSRHGDR